MEIAHFSMFHGQKHFLASPYYFEWDQNLKLVIFAQPVPLLCLDWTKWNEYVQ